MSTGYFILVEISDVDLILCNHSITIIIVDRYYFLVCRRSSTYVLLDGHVPNGFFKIFDIRLACGESYSSNLRLIKQVGDDHNLLRELFINLMGKIRIMFT